MNGFDFPSIAGWIAIALAIITALWLRKRQNERAAEEKARKAQVHAEHVARQQKDEVDNFSRRVFNALNRQKDEIGLARMRVDRIENNGGRYSIYIGVEDDRMASVFYNYRGAMIAQISIEWSDKSPVASVMYGPYSEPWFSADPNTVIQDVSSKMSKAAV